MNFSSAAKVNEVLVQCDDVERRRGANRAKINALANGTPPMDAATAAKLDARVNFNDGSMAVLCQQGRRQYYNAFMSQGVYFKVRIPEAPEQHRADWESYITRHINKPLKQSRAYFDLMRSQFASLLLHGMGPKVWHDDNWLPEYVALEDFRVPGGTKCSLEGLTWFAIRKWYTEGELGMAAFGPHADPGWKKEPVQQILAKLREKNVGTGDNYWATLPEKAVDELKSNGGYYASDKVPKVPLYHFYFQDDSDPKNTKWKMRVVIDSTNATEVSSNTRDFLFDDGDTAVAEELGEILHVQFGDLNNAAPFKVHAVRSLGFLLMEACYWDNIMTCRLVQHLLDNLNAWLRINNPVGQQRAQIVELMNRGILPDGVTVVPQTERHQVNGDLVDRVQGRMKTIKDEASVSYTQDVQGKQSPEETATAVMARVSAVNAMMSGLILTATTYEQFADREICRRFCLENTQDRDCRKFQEKMRKKGIPRQWLDVDEWEIERVTPIGNGNPTLELVMANSLMQNRGAFNPQAQQQILHLYALATTGNPQTAEALAPVEPGIKTTSAQEFAQTAFAVLMQGVPMQPRDDLNASEQAQVLIGLLAGKIAGIEHSGSPTVGDMAGIQTTGMFIQQLIQRMAMDPALGELTKDFSGKLSELMNAANMLGQALAEAQPAQNGDGAAESKLILAQTEAKIKEAQAQQKMHHGEVKFIADQKRRDDAAVQESERQKLRTASEIATSTLKAAAEPVKEPAAVK